jgi:hypothetical protein
MAPIGWIPTDLDPRKMIAVPTLNAVRAVLSRGPQWWRAQPLAPITVKVDDHPLLTEVGGVARVADGPGGGVAVARIGRTSFVAYRLDDEGLRELRVQLDEARGTLRVDPGTTA